MVLTDSQIEAVEKLKNGSILNGSVGSGKSRCGVAYYVKINGGSYHIDQDYKPMRSPPLDLYIITTAATRDKHNWERELVIFGIDPNTVKIDSWNNVRKYVDVKGAFFIFDEQRVVGYGAWAKAFIKIAKRNQWIMLSATPGDNWSDYMSIFIAHGWFKSESDFVSKHVVYKPFVQYASVLRYLNTDVLKEYRKRILVDLEVPRGTVRTPIKVIAAYDEAKYKATMKDRFNYTTLLPIRNISELCMELRRILYTDPSRGEAILKIRKVHKKVIIFYNFNYELEILRNLNYGLDCTVAEWNGKKHEPLPDTEDWVYLVQYTAGCEGWNCTQTDTIIFYSLNYSYKVMEQACGRIDRMNTNYVDLYYYILYCKASIDLGIGAALRTKKKFNEKSFCGE